jgi:tetratricopeptide (TPR) repeat protein
MKGPRPNKRPPTPLARELADAEELLRARRFGEAEAAFRSVLDRFPEHWAALMGLGMLALEAGNPAASVELLARALAKRPSDPALLNNLGNALIAANRPQEAIEKLEKALKARPRFPEALCNSARALRQLGRGEDALRAYERCEAIAPDHAPARIGRNRALLELGRADEAVAGLRAFLEEKPRSVSAYALLARARKFGPGDPEPERVEALLTDPGLRTADRIPLAYAAAKMADDLGDCDRAIAHLKSANRMRTGVADPDYYRDRVDAIISTFTRPFLEERAGWGDPSDLPVFIVGMPRSGTTLTEQILASHPLVRGAGELETLTRLAGELRKATGAPEPYPQAARKLGPELARDFGARYVEEVRRLGPGASRVTDKMPHNFEQLGLIALLLPKARVIHCRRDPVDTCLSCYMHQFQDRHAYNRDLRALGLYYRQYERLMAHWREALPSPPLDIRYEELVADPERHIRRLLDHCGLPWDDRCLAFHETRRSVVTPSTWQVRQPLYTGSVGRWRRYERHLGPLLEALGDSVPPQRSRPVPVAATAPAR